jgi:hypothetical protein
MKAPHIRPNSSGFAKPNVAVSIGYKTIIESQYVHLDLQVLKNQIPLNILLEILTYKIHDLPTDRS